ncbi:MAG TPA: hypothetical protein PK636_00855 [bacterium]|nr:hypothetical protein [bacterium]HPJ71215.1 hypothetical protein [bacterium]HPQ66747.1 hypothetical protein [bacterium]
MKRFGLALAVTAMAWSSVPAADFNGDGTDDIALYRSSVGGWAVRGMTHFYFGQAGDRVVPADYDGDGLCEPAVYRNSTGLWAVRGLTRVYYGAYVCSPLSGDYDGDGTDDIAVFNGLNGLWAVRGMTRLYYGRNGDVPAEPASASSLARVRYRAFGASMGFSMGVTYVDWTGETRSVSVTPADYSWSTSFSAQSMARLYLSIGVPDLPNSHAQLIVNDVLLLDIETQDAAGFDGYLGQDGAGSYYFSGSTWDE